MQCWAIEDNVEIIDKFYGNLPFKYSTLSMDFILLRAECYTRKEIESHPRQRKFNKHNTKTELNKNGNKEN